MFAQSTILNESQRLFGFRFMAHWFQKNAHWSVAILLTISLGLVYLGGVQAIEKIVVFSARENSKTLSETISAFRTLYTQDVVEKVIHSEFEITHLHKDNPRAIPLPATMSIELGKMIGGSGSGTRSYLYSPYPFPWRVQEGGLHDGFRQNAWEYLLANPESQYTKVESVEGRMSIRYARADTMRGACVNCHNTHPESPKTDWKAGDVRGLLEITYPIDTNIIAVRNEFIGAYRYFTLAAVLVFLGIATVIASFRSQISKYKLLEESLLRSNAELSIKNEELDQFAYRSSHDLKAPLSSSRGLASLIELDIESGDLEEAKKNAGLIAKQMLKLETLIVDLLALAQADTVDNDREKVDVESMLKAINDDFSYLCKQNSVEFRTNIALSEPMLAQKTRLSRVCENLIFNSIKYCDLQKENRFVEVSIVEENDRIEISVADNGLGIPLEHQGEVFQKFKRFHTSAAEGSGLGMSIVKRHVDRMGGEISFDSSPEGSTFRIALPKHLG